jgi:O-antigen/teichoic acid export membrane protein
LVIVAAVAVVTIGLAAILAVPLWGSVVSAEGGTEVVLPPALAAAGGIAVSTIALAHLRALSQVKLFVALALLVAWVPAVLGLVVITVQSPRATDYLWGLAAGQCIVGVVAVIIVTRLSPPELSARRVGSALRIGLPTVPHQLAMVAASSLIVILAAHVVDTTAAGKLQLAVLVGSLPVVILAAFNNSWAPMVYRAEPLARPDLISRTATTMAWLAGAVAVGVGLVAPLVLQVIAPAELRGADSVRAAAVVAASAPLMVLYLANIHMVFVSGRTFMMAFTTPLSVVVGCLAAIATYWATPGRPIWTFGLVLPAFYAAQIFLAAWMRHRAGSPRLDLSSAARVALGAVGVCLLLASIDSAFSRYVVGSSIVACLVVVASTRLLMRPRPRSGA